MLCLTIGVSQAPPLSYLPGAITAAHEMGEWARQAGFVTTVITDENKTPVTIQRIRDALLGMFSSNEEVELFVLHFAGHGFRSGAEHNVWLPSDWYRESRAISVEGLRKQLYKHGIKSLSIFGDACRSLPSDLDTADIFGDPVLPRGPYNAALTITDRFSAAVDGQQAYMLKGDDTAPARCVFSTVLLEGLSGLKDAAFDKYLPDCVIPESLALFTAARLREVGETYDLRCTSECVTGIPRDHAVYFQRGRSAQTLPAPRWPAPPSMLQAPVVQYQFPDIDSPPQPHKAKVLKQHIRDGLELKDKVYGRNFNLCVRGAAPKAIWSTCTVERRSSEVGVSNYRVYSEMHEASQILVEFKDGVFASAVVYPTLTTFLIRGEGGETNWTCISREGENPGSLTSSLATMTALQEGSLAANQVDDIAVRLREGKHVNPILGAIASYLYDYAGDIDSIRRMAFYYCSRNQAIPFDIAFMGLLHTRISGHGGFVAEVPEVQERPSSSANAGLPRWITSATPSMAGKVAGLWPWLRQGWQFMDNPMPPEKNAAEGLNDFTRFLLPSQFSSFKAEGGHILIDRFKLEKSK
ncbi:caspase family protein [Delftia acidovorans]|uniref:caspase family protein n=1 Tax=Delftia acidovorans TaxID=80866 RepID=UPI0030190913